MMLIRKSVWMARGSTPAIVVIGNQVTRCLKKPRGVFVSVAWMIRRSCFMTVYRGIRRSNWPAKVGDFVIKRADGCFTYQLAVVVDDLAQGVTQVVRGADLLDSTARQIALVEALNGRVPTYAHIPIVTNPAGEKLSKQTRAAALPTVGEQARVAALWRCAVIPRAIASGRTDAGRGGDTLAMGCRTLVD